MGGSTDGFTGAGGSGTSLGAAPGVTSGASSAGTASSGTSSGLGGSSVVGQPPASTHCPGGPEPATTWKEHWGDHTELLRRVHYDDCIALYVDGGVDPSTLDWLVSFLNRSWEYSLATYGQMGNERLYVVVHQGQHEGGHVATFIQTSHDGHATIDMGASTWSEGDLDLPARLLGFLVDAQGAHTKFGAPKAWHYELGFALIYQYDLYLALGLDAAATEAQLVFDEYQNSAPSPGVHWFRDWFHPLWRDYGRAQLFVRYLSLLEQYYPASDDMWMLPMSYGQYLHFMSGAAGVDLAPVARSASIWRADFDAQIAIAKLQFPEITY
jgi:hypothetical protein